VSDADVEAKVALARSQLLQQGEAEGPRQTLEALLAQKNMTLDEFKQELRNQIALETMIRQDFRIPGDVILQDAAINKWVEDVRRRAALRGPREGLPPGIVAVVNGEEILEAGIVKELAERISRSELEKTLDETLNDRIIERLMKEKKIKIKDEDLDAATKRAEEALHKKPGMASITLESYLQAGGKTLNDLRQQFRHEIGLRKIVSAEITEAQLRAAFQFCQDAYNGKMVHALHILAAAVDLNTLEPLDPYAFERAKVKIENIWQQIRDGASFEDMARKESDDPGTAGKGGDLGFIKRLGDVVEEAAATAFLLRENEVSSPIRSRYGYHLVKVLEIRPGKPVTFEDVKQDVRANLVTATCGKWLDNYKQKLDITKNLGTMGRVEPISSRPRARPLKGQLRP
jgi:parvulin-like peptidyl-prolyl isomerase